MERRCLICSPSPRTLILPIRRQNLRLTKKLRQDHIRMSQVSRLTLSQIAKALRVLLDANGMKAVKIIGYEHNWDNSAFPAAVVCIEFR